METEVRFYFSKKSEEKLLNHLKTFKDLKYHGVLYEKTVQYNHPMKEYDFYSDDIDGRFRIRISKGEKDSKSMITWKRRLKKYKNSKINREEEIEVLIKCEDYENMIYLIENVLHMVLIESYERYRHVFKNNEIEIVVDRFPFGIALEIESKTKDEDSEKVIYDWLNKIGLSIDDSYKLSWDDKYTELCKEQNKKVENIVTFDKDMPQVLYNFE
jgi:hypothetical protein